MKKYLKQFAAILPAPAWFVVSRNYEPFRLHFWLDVLAAIAVCVLLDSALLLIYWKVVGSPRAKGG